MNKPKKTTETTTPGIYHNLPGGTAVVLFGIVPVASCYLAFPLFDYSNTVDRHWLSVYFASGGHALTLAALWGLFAKRYSIASALSTLYILTACICWFAVFFGILSWT